MVQVKLSRHTYAIIDQQAIAENLQVVRRHAPNSKVMAVVKSNGYGHGLATVVKALNDADAFAVACIDEALLLRKLGVNKKIILLEGFHNADEIPVMVENGFECVIHDFWQVEALQKSDVEAVIDVWIKIDTGMRRLGFFPQDVLKVKDMLANSKVTRVAGINYMTHFANADDLSDQKTMQQYELFLHTICDQSGFLSAANSAGILGWEETHLDWVRPGIMLYGVSPFAKKREDLVPAMSLVSQIIAIKECNEGDEVGYGGSWTCPANMKIGVVAIGYGDGYPRHAPSGTPVYVNGKRTEIIGRVSMDMICIDLSSIEKPSIGDEVELWGKNIAVEEVAEHCGTIAYELLCGVTSRVEFKTK